MTRKMTKALALALTVALTATMTPSANVEAAKKKARLNKTKATLFVGDTIKLKVKNVKGKVKWKSSNEKVAKVSKKGAVKAIKSGKATITAKVGNKKFKCKVKVKNKKPITSPEMTVAATTVAPTVATTTVATTVAATTVAATTVAATTVAPTVATTTAAATTVAPTEKESAVSETESIDVTTENENQEETSTVVESSTEVQTTVAESSAEVQTTVAESITEEQTTVAESIIEEQTTVDGSENKNREDVELLKSIIKEQKDKGAKVSGNLNSEQYSWSKDGRLKAIYWTEYGLGIKESLDIHPSGSQFEELEDILIQNCDIESLDIYDLPELRLLDVRDNYNLESLRVDDQYKLEDLYVDNTKISDLDLSNCESLRLLSRENVHFSRLDLPLHTLNYPKDFYNEEDDIVLCDSKSFIDVLYLYMATESLVQYQSPYRLELYEYEWEDDYSGVPRLKSIDLSGKELGGGFTLLLPPCDDENDPYKRPLCMLETIDLSDNDELVNICVSNVKGDLQSVKFDRCSGLKGIHITNNASLQSISDITDMDDLYYVDLCDNKELRDISIYFTNSLYKVAIDGCEQLNRLIICRTMIRELNIVGSPNIMDVDIDSNYSLDSLYINPSNTLEYLEVRDNHLTSIDLSGFPNLRKLTCEENFIRELDVSNNLELKDLDCSHAKISELDVSNNLKLEDLNCSYTNIRKLDVSNNLELERLYCSDTNISELDVSNNLGLKYLMCICSDIRELDVSNNLELKNLSCFLTKISELDVSNNLELEDLDCSYTNISELDVSNNLGLKYLDCSNTNISELDLSNNLGLKRLYCSHTNISELDLSNNTLLSESDTYVDDTVNVIR
jgi:hypothetical protein